MVRLVKKRRAHAALFECTNWVRRSMHKCDGVTRGCRTARLTSVDEVECRDHEQWVRNVHDTQREEMQRVS